jgi:carbamoyl-phosphate synthase large subunit
VLGKRLKDFPELKKRIPPYVGVKEAVFPFNMFPEVDPLLGPEMKSTGEVMGMADSFGLAFYKAEEAAGSKLPVEGNVLLTVADKDKPNLLSLAEKISKLPFKIYATEGTASLLTANNIPNTPIKKLHEGRPNLTDAIKNRDVHLIVNTPAGRSSKYDDSYIRMMAIQYKVPYITTIAAAEASFEGIEAVRTHNILPRSLQEYHKEVSGS